MKVFMQLTAVESKALKAELKTQGLNFRVQLKNGRIYLYNGANVMEPAQKEIVRDVLVLLNYCDCLGNLFTNPTSGIYNGMPVCAMA
jgi:hypothetical protein